LQKSAEQAQNRQKRQNAENRAETRAEGAEQRDRTQNAMRRRRAQSGKEDSKARDDFIALAAQSASRSGMPSRFTACGFRVFSLLPFWACCAFPFPFECFSRIH